MFPCDWSPIEMMMWLRVFIGGGGGEETTVSGVSPLSLTNALAKNIISLTQYGLCTQASTPTLSSPVDIKCNNGAIKARRPSGLPLGYQKVEYIQSTGTQYINTGFTISDLTENYRVHYRITVDGYTGNPAVSNQLGYTGQNSGLMLTLTRDNGLGLASSGVPLVADHIYDITHTRGSDASRGLVIDETSFTISDQSTVYADRPFGIFKLSPFGTTFNVIYGKLYEFQAYKNGTLIKNLVPCRRLSDSVLGVYDLANNVFLTNAGTNTFTAGSDVSDPVELYADGTAEVITVTHANSTTETAGAEDLFAVGTYADTQDIISGLVTRNTGVLILNGTENFLPAEGTVLTNCYTLAIPLGDAPMANRRVVCTHFKSSDTLPDSNARQGYALIGNGGNNTPAPLTNKYAVGFGAKTAYPSIDSFKAFLAAQYASGTPVIVVYPLAEPTTETATPQPLNTTKGTNTVTATAEVSPIQLSVVYMAKSE